MNEREFRVAVAGMSKIFDWYRQLFLDTTKDRSKQDGTEKLMNDTCLVVQ